MKLLLDTHVFLWWNAGATALNPAAHAALADPANQIQVSAASVWEIAIKARLGKLAITGRPDEAIAANGFSPLPISAAHAYAAGALDWPHRDPFDRMLVVQATAEGASLVHADQAIRGYASLPQLWAARYTSRR